MSYTVRRWWTLNDKLFDDIEQADTAEDTIALVKRMAEPFDGIPDEKMQEDIRAMEKGKTIRMRKGYLKLTIRVHRNMR